MTGPDESSAPFAFVEGARQSILSPASPAPPVDGSAFLVQNEYSQN
jgi:hypothetical protein